MCCVGILYMYFLSLPADRDINPEVIQRQIVELRPEWSSFGSAVGLPQQFLDEVRGNGNYVPVSVYTDTVGHPGLPLMAGLGGGGGGRCSIVYRYVFACEWETGKMIWLFPPVEWLMNFVEHISYIPPTFPLSPSLFSHFLLPPPSPSLPQVHSSYTDNKDRLAEVVYEWYGGMRTVTWADVAGVCRKIGHYDLADSLEKAYDTGGLHTCSLLLCEALYTKTTINSATYCICCWCFSSVHTHFCNSPSLPFL